MGEMEDWARLLGGIGSGLRVSLPDVHTMEDSSGADSTTSGDIPVRRSADPRQSAHSRKREAPVGGSEKRFGPPAPAVEEGGGPLVDSVGHRRQGGAFTA